MVCHIYELSSFVSAGICPWIITACYATRHGEQLGFIRSYTLSKSDAKYPFDNKFVVHSLAVYHENLFIRENISVSSMLSGCVARCSEPRSTLWGDIIWLSCATLLGEMCRAEPRSTLLGVIICQQKCATLPGGMYHTESRSTPSGKLTLAGLKTITVDDMHLSKSCCRPASLSRIDTVLLYYFDFYQYLNADYNTHFLY